MFAMNSNCVISASFGWKYHSLLVGNKLGITMQAFVDNTQLEHECQFHRPFVAYTYESNQIYSAVTLYIHG